MAWADRSPLERVQINYCAPRGIPLSQFAGRAVYPGDPAWLDDDREAVLDWLEKEASRCERCGQDTRESMKLENAYTYRAKGLRCHSCYAIDAEAAQLTRSKPGPMAGIRFQVTKVEDGD